MDGLLSKKFLQDIGIEIDDQTYQALSGHYEATLHERVVTEIVDELDERQLQELHDLKDGDADARAAWLAGNVSNLDEIIEDEIAILLGEIAENSDRI